MNRRELFKKASAIAAAGFTVGMSLEAKADALEHAMSEQLDYQIPEPAAFCDVNWPRPIPNFEEMAHATRPNLMHHRSAPADDARATDPDRLFQAALGSVITRAAERQHRARKGPGREGYSRLPAA